MPDITRRTLLALSLLAVPGITPSVAQAQSQTQSGANSRPKTLLRRVPTQYIAALGAPDATSGTGAQNWGWWYEDPGPRGVWLNQYEHLMAAGGVARKGWVFDKTDWWLDENGILMEKPVFKVQPGRFVVTGGREAVAILTIHPRDADGEMRWELSKDTRLHDVTHLECRAARYTPTSVENACSPANVDPSVFKVKPGADMPDVPNCNKKDYTVLFVIGVAVDGGA